MRPIQLQKLINETNTSLYGHLDAKDKTLLIKLLKGIETIHSVRLLDITRKKR